MKHIPIIIVAVVLIGCGESQQSATAPEAKPVAEAATPEPTTAKAPDISIYDAVTEGNIEAVKQHLAAGTDVNDEFAFPLHLAASCGHKEIAELLIANGADVNAKTDDEETPLNLAAFEGHKEIAELLIANGADVNAKNRFGMTALNYTITQNRKKFAELLIANGADVDDGWTWKKV